MMNLKKHLNKIFSETSSIAIITHKNPDGDGFAASLALKRILKNNNIDLDIVLEEPSPEVYTFLDGRKNSRVFSEDLSYETVLLLDCHEIKRVGKCAPLISKAKNIIAIDHHHEKEIINNSYTFIDPDEVSTGKIIYDLYKDEIEILPQEDRLYVATCLYTTILNDTDNFMNANVTSEVFSFCSILVDYGIIPGSITEQFLLNKPANEMKFIGEVLATLDSYKNDQIVFIDSTLEMLNRNHLTHEATSKLTRWLKGTRNAKVIVYFREVDKDFYRLSLRSNFIDVNLIAREFGGGGHTKASGCEIHGALTEVKEIILKKIEEQLF